MQYENGALVLTYLKEVLILKNTQMKSGKKFNLIFDFSKNFCYNYYRKKEKRIKNLSLWLGTLINRPEALHP